MCPHAGLSSGREDGESPLRFLIDQDLREKRLFDITGKHLRGGTAEIVAARRREAPHGPIANRLWSYIEERAKAFVEAIS
jgi:hypothetical protein